MARSYRRFDGCYVKKLRSKNAKYLTKFAKTCPHDIHIYQYVRHYSDGSYKVFQEPSVWDMKGDKIAGKSVKRAVQECAEIMRNGIDEYEQRRVIFRSRLTRKPFEYIS